MFNYTDPKTLGGKDANNKYGLQHQHYFNAGVRYYPKTMSQEVWDLGWKYANDWDYNIWGTEQIIFNEMMYSENKDVKQWHDPTMNFQMMNAVPQAISNPHYIAQIEAWNGANIDDAKEYEPIIEKIKTAGQSNFLGINATNEKNLAPINPINKKPKLAINIAPKIA